MQFPASVNYINQAELSCKKLYWGSYIHLFFDTTWVNGNWHQHCCPRITHNSREKGVFTWPMNIWISLSHTHARDWSLGVRVSLTYWRLKQWKRENGKDRYFAMTAHSLKNSMGGGDHFIGCWVYTLVQTVLNVFFFPCLVFTFWIYKAGRWLLPLV